MTEITTFSFDKEYNFHENILLCHFLIFNLLTYYEEDKRDSKKGSRKGAQNYENERKSIV